MGHFLHEQYTSFRKGDMTLLLLCLLATAFGMLAISSATNFMETHRALIMQIIGAGVGVFLYAIFSSIDLDYLAEHKWFIVGLTYFLLLLLIPFGTDNGTGNRSWLRIPLLPFNIQPAEFCKIGFIIILATVMASHQEQISSIKSVGAIVLHTILIVVFNLALSSDLGVSLIFIVIFVVMAFTGGISYFWLSLGAGAFAFSCPFLYQSLSPYRKTRIRILWDDSIDPMGIGPRYHTIQSLRSLSGGGLTGQGLFNGHRTQMGGVLPAQHTDYIFSTIGEELGFVGCVAVLLVLLAIIARCIWVGCRSKDYLRRMVCFGSAAALICQVTINVGMCLGRLPVIGLTLPFFSSGGSSIMSIYIMLGLVSGVYARPEPTVQERYIRPPYYSRLT